MRPSAKFGWVSSLRYGFVIVMGDFLIMIMSPAGKDLGEHLPNDALRQTWKQEDSGPIPYQATRAMIGASEACCWYLAAGAIHRTSFATALKRQAQIIDETVPLIQQAGSIWSLHASYRIAVKSVIDHRAYSIHSHNSARLYPIHAIHHPLRSVVHRAERAYSPLACAAIRGSPRYFAPPPDFDHPPLGNGTTPLGKP
jgi:hypothetical protein